MKLKYTLAAGAIALVLAAFTYRSTNSTENPSTEQTVGLRIGDEAPELALTDRSTEVQVVLSCLGHQVVHSLRKQV